MKLKLYSWHLGAVIHRFSQLAAAKYHGKSVIFSSVEFC